MWKQLEKRAKRLGAMGTAFVYRPATEFGNGTVFAAATAERRHSTFLSFDGRPVEVSSITTAEKLVTILATAAGDALRADYTVRERTDFIRAEVERRNRVLGLRDRALRAASAARSTGDVNRAEATNARAVQHDEFASQISKEITYRRALLDPTSAESVAAATEKAARAARIAAYRANQAIETAA